MKLIIAGSRHLLASTELIGRFVRAAFPNVTEIVSGGARGIDLCGEEYAAEAGLPCKVFPADWDRLGKAAGPARNAQMAEYADAALVFWNGGSSGSRNMLAEMKRRGKPYVEVRR